jgi:hypothetical protein
MRAAIQSKEDLMRFRNIAVVCFGVAACAPAFVGCSGADESEPGLQTDSEDLRWHCKNRHEEYHSRCTDRCVPWGDEDDDHAKRKCDAGAPVTDAGSPTKDSGTPTKDSGTPTNDAAPPARDAGPPVTDSGPQPTTCTSFTYSAWGACQSGTQSRTVVSSSPAGCTGGSPVLTQACTSIDGAALWAQKCESCHDGAAGKNWSASQIQDAINTISKHSSLRTLTAEQIAALADATK